VGLVSSPFEMSPLDPARGYPHRPETASKRALDNGGDRIMPIVPIVEMSRDRDVIDLMIVGERLVRKVR